MANSIEVKFRRGSDEKYKTRWDLYFNYNNQDYAYLKDAIYFATDTGSIYLNGIRYTTTDNSEIKLIVDDIDSLHLDVSTLQSKTTIQTLGDGDVISSLYNDEDSSTLTIVKNNIVDANLKNYDTSIGSLNSGETINSAIKNLDERTVWQYFYDTENE